MAVYAPMMQFLTAQATDRVRLDFQEVERILGRPLPKSAGDYQAWWANDPTHSQAKAWLEAGWQTENLNLGGRTVEFVRVLERRSRQRRRAILGVRSPVASPFWMRRR